ncbi:hypothetical protein [Leifsonia poae]|uniref:hypothetical protein n=1 Tax=Leifsonia poae TaxID=110933 RepID=UPI001CBBF88A|nr:hypothetical protein [Leifsonia poae]
MRNRGIKPTFTGRLSEDEELRREFLAGSRRMGYELVDLDDREHIAELKAMTPPRYPIQPQQLWMVDALNAEDYDTFTVEVMRRASKTTTIFCWLVGRCESRPGYEVTFSAQSGVKSSARLREWKLRLDAINPPDDLDLPPWLRNRPRTTKRAERALALFDLDITTEAEHLTAGRGFKVMMGEVGKGIYWDNGSKFLVLKPSSDAYRGEAGDISWLDEAQELDPEEGADLLAGLAPLQDTKENAATVISGTAGEARVGPFWEVVAKLRAGDPDVGGVDYCASDSTPWEIIEDEDQAIALLVTLHPGIGTLTTEEKMRKNWRKLDKPKWAREYLSLWPESFGTTAVNALLWEDAALARKKAKPDRVAFGLDIRPGGFSAAIVVAWRDSRGVAYVEVVEHRQSTSWIPERMQELTRTYRGSTIAFDDISEGKATATEADRLSPKPRLRMQTYREHAAGCVQFLRDLERGKLKHSGQVSLDTAVAVAVKRDVRGSQGVWMWGAPVAGGDITPLVAATRALRNWDQYFARGTGSTGVVIAA